MTTNTPFKPRLAFVNAVEAELLNEVNQPDNVFPDFVQGWYIDGIYIGRSLTRVTFWHWVARTFNVDTIGVSAAIGAATSDSMTPRGISADAVSGVFAYLFGSVLILIFQMMFAVFVDLVLYPIDWLFGYLQAYIVYKSWGHLKYESGKTNYDIMDFIENVLEYSPFRKPVN